MRTVPTTASGRLVRRSREALSALAAEFVLGMIVNLLPDTAGRLLHSVVLGLHVLIGIGIIVIAVRVLLATQQDRLGRQEALWALIVLVVTFASGVLTVVFHSGWLSFIMAAGFLAAVLLYIRTLVIGTVTRQGA